MADALNPMLEAVVAALNGDATVSGLVTGVFSARAPRDQAFDYIVIVDMATDGIGRFGATAAARRIDRGTFSLRIWARDFSSAATIFAAVKDVLDRKKIVVDGHQNLAGKVEMIATIPEPSDSAAVQSVVNYGWIAHVNP